MKHKTRIIAIILSLLMIFCAVPAYAAEDKDTLDKAKFQGAVPNDKAEEIHFCKKTDMPAEATKDKGDISVAGAGGKIHVYADNTEKKYWVVHEADGKIFFPKDSERLFFEYKELTALTFDQIDTGEVTTMREMFEGCKKLTDLDLSQFHTENVTDMGWMFTTCEKLSGLDVSSFHTGKVTDMNAMFFHCEALTTLDVRNFNTENVTDMSAMFDACEKLSGLDVSSFHTENVTDMQEMFYQCKALTALDVRNFNTEKVINMKWMFDGCEKLTSLDLRSFHTGEVTEMQEMFKDCKDLTTITASGQFITTKVTNSNNMFQNCIALVGGQGTVYNPAKIDKEYARIDGGIPNPGYFTGAIHTVSFDKNGGGGAMPDVTVNDGDNYTLPPCGFTPPAGQVFDQWEADGTKYNPGDIINNIIADLSVKAIWKAKPATPYIPSTTIPSTEEDQTPEEWITLETVVNGKTYTARSTKNAFNGAVKLDIAIGEQGKTHFNFLDKEGNKVQTKGAVKLTMPLPEGLTPPYRVKVEGTYTTFAEEQGQISFVIRPTGDVEKIHLTGIAEGETVNVEGTPYALNGAKEIKVERKGNGKLSIRLIDQNGKPVRSKGYLFIQIPVPKNTKAPYRVKVDGVRTTFEETGHGTVVFASIL